MSTEIPQEQNVDEVLEQIDFEKLGTPGVEQKTELPLPAHVELFHRGSDLEIVRKWFGWDTLLRTAMLVVVGVIAFSTIKGSVLFKPFDSINGLESTLFHLIFVAVTAYLAYSTLAGWLNRTRILVGQGKITVRHGPLPWPGNKVIEVSTLKQLYTEEIEHRGSKGGTYMTYDVRATTDTDPKLKLVSGLRSEPQARFIEKQIEQYLGIQDRY